MKLRILACILIGMFGIVPACYGQSTTTETSIEDVQKETQDLLEVIASYTAEKRDEAIQQAKDGLQKLDNRIDALEKRVDDQWDKMSEAARSQTRENLRTLRKQRNEVAEWYGSLKSSSDEAWGHMKKGFSDAYKALEDAWVKSEKEFQAEE